MKMTSSFPPISLLPPTVLTAPAVRHFHSVLDEPASGSGSTLGHHKQTAPPLGNSSMGLELSGPLRGQSLPSLFLVHPRALSTAWYHRLPLPPVLLLKEKHSPPMESAQAPLHAYSGLAPTVDRLGSVTRGGFPNARAARRSMKIRFEPRKPSRVARTARWCVQLRGHNVH
ncbi:uncharacterized protein B0T15DRAFT_229968 [Chaetomium strumarium]|uniref:Uncharacterized protein n=1 Tax=Chaetomium strumarium TaxID=1170767 RepID=A0AAJ0GQK6_9PEZI|nr:hypothetical protein B0T15DRAFT_229968 [Chaetomium strumarium]